MKTCQNCGVEFNIPRRTKFCSASCKSKKHSKKHQIKLLNNPNRREVLNAFLMKRRLKRGIPLDLPIRSRKKNTRNLMSTKVPLPKPCIKCGKECEILPVQLGDSFTLTYLRVCCAECMFIIGYEYLYEIGAHKDFRNKLYDKQNEEDKKLRDEFIHVTSMEFLKNFRKNCEANPNLLSTPVPNCISAMFADMPNIPENSGCVMTFTRPSKEDKIKWQKEYIVRLNSQLEDALQELRKFEGDNA